MHIHAPTTTTTTTAGPYGWDRGLNKTGAYRLSQHLLARSLLAVPTVTAHTSRPVCQSCFIWYDEASRSSDNRVKMYTGCIGTAPGESVCAYARQTLHCCPTLSAMYAASVITAEALHVFHCRQWSNLHIIINRPSTSTELYQHFRTSLRSTRASNKRVRRLWNLHLTRNLVTGEGVNKVCYTQH